MNKEKFTNIIGKITEKIGIQPLDHNLETFLNQQFPHDSKIFSQLGQLCAKGEAEGWLVNQEFSGIKFGRVIKPNSGAGIFSVDVVRMKNIAGPHHIHPEGEIGAIVPINKAPLFDGKNTAWYVYPSGTDHFPTVTNGDAYIVYFLPSGAIKFTGKVV